MAHSYVFLSCWSQCQGTRPVNIIQEKICILCQRTGTGKLHNCTRLLLSSYAFNYRSDSCLYPDVADAQNAVSVLEEARKAMRAAMKLDKTSPCNQHKLQLVSAKALVITAAANEAEKKAAAGKKQLAYTHPDDLDPERFTASRHQRQYQGIHYSMIHFCYDSGACVYDNLCQQSFIADSDIIVTTSTGQRNLWGLFALTLNGVLTEGYPVCLYSGVSAGDRTYHEDYLSKHKRWIRKSLELAIMQTGPKSSKCYVDPSLIGGIAVIMNQKCTTNLKPVHLLAGGRYFTYMCVKRGNVVISGEELLWDYEASCTHKAETIKCVCKGLPDLCNGWVCKLVKKK